MKPTVHRYSYTWPLATLSKGLSPLSKMSTIGSLAALDVARSAFKAEGMSMPDKAERDRIIGPEFEHVLGMLGQGHFAPLGRIHWRAVLVSAVRARIRYEQYMAEGRPMGEVVDPIFVVGLPRTGTSLVQRLIAEDDERRGLRTFELLNPIPPAKPSKWEDMKRMGYGRLSSMVYKTFTPELIKIHHTSPTSLEECWMLFMPSYAVLNADYVYPETTQFGDWLLDGDIMNAAYERYANQLRILSLEAADKKLVLKAPEHLWFLESLVHAFPRARIIWIHRDPAKAVPSYSAQVSLPARQHRGNVEPELIGDRVRLRFAQGLERGTRFCDEHPEARISHLKYADLIADPTAALRKSYDEIDLEMSSQHAEAISAFMSRPPRDKGTNVYRSEDYGFTEDEIREEFREYTERFGVAEEKKRS